MSRCFCPCHQFPGTYPPPCGVCGHDTREGRMVGGYRDGWEPTPKPDWQAEYAELQRRAIAVTRIWDMLARCYDEFTNDGSMERGRDTCAEYEESLDTAILGLMKLVDRPMWERREQEMKDASEASLRS